MRTPREIYAQYKIMPNLQMHQLRVAAVARLICGHTKERINERDVVLECLFHDMGNVVKFDLAYFPEFVQPEGQAYWESVKADFMQKYGREQHAANSAIARELGLPLQVIDMMNESGFSHISDVVEKGSPELKVCQYADLRVSPHGIVSLDERLQDFSLRYAKKGGVASEGTLHASRELEQRIFAGATIRPEDINDASVAPMIEELWEYHVS